MNFNFYMRSVSQKLITPITLGLLTCVSVANADTSTQANHTTAPEAAPIITYGPVAEGETLWSIAAKYISAYPPEIRKFISVHQTVLATFYNNQDKFKNSNIHDLAPGSELEMPTIQQIRANSVQDALNKMDEDEKTSIAVASTKVTKPIAELNADEKPATPAVNVPPANNASANKDSNTAKETTATGEKNTENNQAKTEGTQKENAQTKASESNTSKPETSQSKAANGSIEETEINSGTNETSLVGSNDVQVEELITEVDRLNAQVEEKNAKLEELSKQNQQSSMSVEQIFKQYPWLWILVIAPVLLFIVIQFLMRKRSDKNENTSNEQVVPETETSLETEMSPETEVSQDDSTITSETEVNDVEESFEHNAEATLEEQLDHEIDEQAAHAEEYATDTVDSTIPPVIPAFTSHEDDNSNGYQSYENQLDQAETEIHQEVEETTDFYTDSNETLSNDESLSSNEGALTFASSESVQDAEAVQDVNEASTQFEQTTEENLFGQEYKFADEAISNETAINENSVNEVPYSVENDLYFNEPAQATDLNLDAEAVEPAAVEPLVYTAYDNASETNQDSIDPYASLNTNDEASYTPENNPAPESSYEQNSFAQEETYEPIREQEDFDPNSALQNKLDLAKAYLNMGENERSDAITMLNQVMREGDDSLREQALKLLENI